QARLVRAQPGAAVLLGDQHGQPARLGDGLHELLRVAACLVRLLPVLAGEPPAEVADRRADVLRVRLQPGVHITPPAGPPARAPAPGAPRPGARPTPAGAGAAAAARRPRRTAARPSGTRRSPGGRSPARCRPPASAGRPPPRRRRGSGCTARPPPA